MGNHQKLKNWEPTPATMWFNTLIFNVFLIQDVVLTLIFNDFRIQNVVLRLYFHKFRSEHAKQFSISR